MSEQTRHATPNLLISIHILWLLISSLLHSLSTHLPPSPHLCFTSLSTAIPYLPLLFYPRPSPAPLSFSIILFFASPQFALLYPSSRLLLFSLRFGFCLRAFFPLHLSSPLFHLPSPLTAFHVEGRIHGTSSISVSLSAVSPFVEIFTRYVARRDIQCALVLSLFRGFHGFSSLFMFRHHEISSDNSQSDDSSLAVGTASGIVGHKSLNNSNVTASFPLFFFL